VSPGVAFFGYGELGLAGLDTLVSAGACLSVVVVPSNRSGAGVDLIRDAAARYSLPVLVQPSRDRIRPFVESLRVHDPDVVIVWSYSMILPPAVLAVPARGAVNVHGGLLPQYRGGHVAQWAIINGEREFGVTLHYMDEGIDTGPVIAEQRFALDETDDGYTVRQKIRAAGSHLLTEWWPRLADGTARSRPQDSSRARYWPMRATEEGRIDWTIGAEAVCRLVRALRCNTPGAYLEAGGRQISVRRAEPHRTLAAGGEPGSIVAADASGVRVSTAQGDVTIITAEIDGSPVSAAALRGLLNGAGGISGGRVRIVLLERRHLDRTREWANDPEIMSLMDRARHVAADEHDAWFVSIAGREDCAYFAIETPDAGVHVGNVWLWAIDRRHRKAEIRIVIGDPAVRGQGVGTAAIDQLCRHGFDALGLHRIYAYVLAVNLAARRAFERAGFTLEGTLRHDRWAGDTFVDTYLLARLRER
jgi:methionyl-tRNA formyltransferase